MSIKKLSNKLNRYKQIIVDFIELQFYDLKYRLNEILWMVRYRTTRKYHIVDTKLEPGYHCHIDRMLHANFQILVEFVERDCCDLYKCYNEKYDRSLSDGQIGLLMLDWWESKANHDNIIENLSDTIKKHLSDINRSHMINATEAKALYNWWKNRSNRLDPYSYFEPFQFNALLPSSTSGEPELQVNKDIEFVDFGEDSEPVPNSESDGAFFYKVPEKRKDAYNKYAQLTDLYEREDQEMLKRLIDIRMFLWT